MPTTNQAALARGTAHPPDLRFLIGESWPIVVRFVDRFGAQRDLAGLIFAGTLYARGAALPVAVLQPDKSRAGNGDAGEACRERLRFVVPPGITAAVPADPEPVDYWPTRFQLTAACGESAIERIVGLFTIAVGDPRTAAAAPIAGEQVVTIAEA